MPGAAKLGAAAEVIRGAIEARRILAFGYKGSLRTAEPYILGFDSRGKLVLSAVQLSGGTGRGFRSFDLDRLSAVTATDRHFQGSHPDYNPRDVFFERVICQIRPERDR